MSQRFFIEFLPIPTLKSPMKMKLSQDLLCSSMTQFKHSRWLDFEFLWGFYEQFKNPFLLFKLISTERLPVLRWDLDSNKSDGMSSLMYNRRSPPLSFLLCVYGVVKFSILNWAKGNESSSFVSEIRKMSMLLSSIYIKESNLVLTEFMFTWPKISLWGGRIFISFSPVLASKTSVTDFHRSAILGLSFKYCESSLSLFARFVKSTG